MPAPLNDAAPGAAAAPAFGHPHHVAAAYPDKTALRFEPSGRSIGFAELERASNQAAHAMRALGLQAGDVVAMCLPNAPELLYAVGAAMRIGVYFTLLPVHASAADLAYIVRDSGARLVIAGASLAGVPGLRALLGADGAQAAPLYLQGGAAPGDTHDWDALAARQPATLPERPLPGREMLYSSGSTGRPKGVRKPLPDTAWDAPDARNMALARTLALTSESVFLSTSPLYHSAPQRYLLSALAVGATSIVMERFDAECALQCIAGHGCTHSLWVPTMFQRLLKLDPATRARWSTRSMSHAAHGAAPCPVHVKEAMIDWWGPVFYEYYSGTEGVGTTWIDTPAWLAHKGSVGLAQQCRVHVLDDQGRELPAGETGTVYFDSPVAFSYWNDPQKTRAATSAQGWRTFGDIGHVDADGYLYLTDRRDFMLISGGVNIYPQEVEHALLVHPVGSPGTELEFAL